MSKLPGFGHILLLLVAAILLFALFFNQGKRVIFQAYTHALDKAGFNINNIATDDYVNWIKSQKYSKPKNTQAIFLNQKVAGGDTFAKDGENEVEILGDNAQIDDSKSIVVDLSEQRLYMKQDGKTIGSFLVSTGRWFPTPTGQWRIWGKFRTTTMEGGSKELSTYYNLPNVPYTMYYDRGYGIHGAYWHNNFGTPMSHGCTNMKPEEAAIVYNWAPVGTKVIVQQ